MAVWFASADVDSYIQFLSHVCHIPKCFMILREPRCFGTVRLILQSVQLEL